jgi:hydrogenase-4 component F
MPWTGAGWILSAAGVTGAPPFGTFVGELLIVVGALAAGLAWVAGLVILAILIAFLGVNSQIGRMVLGDARTDRPVPSAHRNEGLGVVYLNLAVALALGLASLPYLSPALATAAALLGGKGP